MVDLELNRVIQAMHYGVVVHDASGAIVQANAAAASVLGLTLDQLYGRSSLDSRWSVIHQDGRPFPGESHPSMVTLSTGQPQVDVIMGVKRPDDVVSWIKVSSEPLYEEDGTTIDGVVVTFVDITAELEATDAHKRSEGECRSFFENMVDIYYRVDAEGLITLLSPSASEVIGYHPEDLIGTPVAMIYAEPQKRSQFLEALYTNGGALKGYELELRHKDGSKFWVATSAHTRLDNEGKVCCIEGTIRDISEAKRIETELQRSEKFNQIVLDTTQAGIAYIGSDGRFIKANPYFCDFVGYTPDELTQLSPTDFTHPDDLEQTLQIIQAIKEGERAPLSMEKRYICSNGKTCWTEVITTGIYDNQGVLSVRLLTVVDIDKRKRMELQLRDSEKQFRDTVELVPIPMAIIGAECHVKHVNRKFVELFGWTLGDVSTEDRWWTCLYPDKGYREKVKKSWVEAAAGALAGGYEIAPQLWSVTCKNGARRDVEFRMVDTGENQHVIAMNDITERLAAERALNNSEELFRAFFQHSPFGALLSDKNGKFLRSNIALQKFLGYSAEELQQLHFRDFTVEADIEPNMVLFNELVEGKRDSYQMEKRYRNKSGEIKWGNLAVAAIRDTDGSVKTIFSMVEDIGERVSSMQEQSKLQRQLQQAQKMEAIGQLTGGIAHDFNNILASILGYSELAIDYLVPAGNDKLKNALVEIQRGGMRAAHLVEQMLDFGRGHPVSPEPINAEIVLKEVLEMAGSTIPSSVQLELQWDNTIPLMMANPVQLHQVLLNLIINARDEMDGQGKIQVTGSWGVQNAVCNGCHESFSGNYVELSIRDSAGTLTEEVLERIFDPFFTTKSVGKGTGMGLSMVHGIIHGWGGHIGVTLAPGEATTFHLYIPADEGPVSGRANSEQEVKESIGIDAVKQSERLQRVMVVDDDLSIGLIVDELLKIHGYEVALFSDSREALRVFKDEPDSYDLLLTDQTMPHMTGVELIQSLHLIRPSLPVILCSGYSEMVNQGNAHDFGIDTYLDKPIDSGKLFSAIGSLLALRDDV